jgi:hypothetical protein
MKKLLIGLAVDDAEAARFGRGRSFGVPRQMKAPRPATPQAAPATPARTPAAAPQRRPIAGLAAGIGLTALFSRLGLSEKLANNVANLLLLIMAAAFVFRCLFRRNA